MSWQDRLDEHRATAHIPWTPQETALALELREGGSSLHEIAHALSRTMWGVRSRFRTIGQDERLGPGGARGAAVYQPYPGVERCKRCFLAEPHECTARTVTEHVARFMRSPSE